MLGPDFNDETKIERKALARRDKRERRPPGRIPPAVRQHSAQACADRLSYG